MGRLGNRSMIEVESLGHVVRLTPEYLSVDLSESTVRALRNLAGQRSDLREALESLLRWADFPLIWVRDIDSVSLEAVPTEPGGEHMLKLLISARCRGGQRIYEIRLGPDEAKMIASEIEGLIRRGF
ncbi:MAG: hypothetical protein QXU06_01615 [Candidatus Bathyarchaeia archaeon]